MNAEPARNPGNTAPGWEGLANGIVIQAAVDYVKAQKKLRADPGRKDARKAIAEIEAFFHSAWFSVLTEADPDVLLERLRRESKAA